MTTAPGEGLATGAWGRRSRGLLLLMAGVGSANTLAETIRGIRFPDQADWPIFVAAGRLLRSAPGSLYDLQAQMDAQRSLLGGHLNSGFIPFRIPAPVAALYEPFALLPLGTGRILFAVASLVVLAAAILLLRRLAGAGNTGAAAAVIAVMAATTLPAGETFLYSQPVAFILVALVGALAMLSRGHGFAAGLLLGVGLAKPQVIWLVVPLLLVLREWRVIGGLTVAAVAWWLVGAVLVGPGWWLDWLRVALSNGSEISISDGLPGLANVLTHSTAAVVAVAGAGLALWAAAVWRWRGTLAGSPATALALGVAASISVAPHVFAHDLLLVAPLIVLMSGRVGPRLLLASVATLDIAYVAGNSLLGVPQLDGLVLSAITVWFFAAVVVPRSGREPGLTAVTAS